MAEYENHNRNGSITAALTTGIIGTGLGLLNGNGGVLGNVLGGGAACNNYVTKDALDMAMQLAEKDSQIALLKSEQNTEVKIADVYEKIMTRVNADKALQTEINTAQAVYNGTNSAALQAMQNSIAVLQGMTKVIIPATNICPEPMNRYNSWVAPVQAAAAEAAK